jgi:hypothetical protein
MTHAHRTLLKWARLLHVYLTLFGFALLLFFAVTGFMLNHEEWFLPRQSTTGKLPTEWLTPPENRDAIVNRLLEDFGALGELKSFEADDAGKPIRVVFHGEDGDSVAVIQRADGTAVVTHDRDRSRERIVITEGKMPLELLVPDDPTKELPIVEVLRREFGARGEVNSPPRYEKESESFQVVFKAPGYLATATIRAADGQTRVTHQSRGLAGVMLDLHRGKESGLPWSFAIDAVSVLLVAISITGLILWSSLRGRAQHGLAVLASGAAVGFAIYFVSAPR